MSLTSFCCPIIFKHISHFVLVFSVFLLLTLNRQNACWVVRVTVSKNRDTFFLLLLFKNVEKRTKRSQRRTENLRHI